MQTEREMRLNLLKQFLVGELNALRSLPDISEQIQSCIGMRLAFKEKIALLNLIALSHPSNTINLLPEGRRIFDEVVEEIFNRLPTGLSSLRALPDKKTFVLDLHPTTTTSDNRWQFEGLGFTYFFLDRASTIQGCRFKVCPGVGHGSKPENMIQGLNPTRYGVIRYLTDLLSIEENPKRKKDINHQLIEGNRFLTVYPRNPSHSPALIQTQEGLEGLISAVTNDCIQHQRVSTRHSGLAFGGAVLVKDSTGLSPNQLNKIARKAQKALDSAGPAERKEETWARLIGDAPERSPASRTQSHEEIQEELSAGAAATSPPEGSPTATKAKGTSAHQGARLFKSVAAPAPSTSKEITPTRKNPKH